MNNNKCKHCGTDCGNHPVLWSNESFCCYGCQQVYQLLNEHKLTQYYKFVENAGIKADSSQYVDKYAFLDKPEVQNKLFEFREGDMAKVTFFIPAVHCVSCIWLLEHLNRLNSGIKLSSVNFITKTTTLTFNTSEISLRQVVELLVSVHYIPDISLQTLESKNIPKNSKALLYKTGVAGFIFGNVMLYSLPQYFNGKPIDDGLSVFLNYLSFILTFPLLLYCGSDYFISAYKGLRNKIVNIDLPIALGLFALFAVTSYEVISQTGQGYSDSLSGLLFFLLVGKWYQSKTYESLSFDRDYKSYFPVAVTKTDDGREQSILLEDVRVGDCLLIRNRELIPADSILLSGNALIDYSFVTGESASVSKSEGEFLYAGGIQTQGAITIKVTKEVSQSHLTSLWNQSSSKSAHIVTISSVIDRLSVYFTIFIIALSVSGFLWWFLKGNLHTAIMVLSSVLIVTCPCALALSLPFTFGNAMRMLGLKGLYLKNSQVIEKFTRVNTVVFDKTGTLTVPDQNNIVFVGEQLTDIELEGVVSVAKQSAHPLSNALVKHFAKIATSPTTGFVEMSGKGIFATVNNMAIKLGALTFVNDNCSQLVAESSSVYVSINNQYKGYFKISNCYRLGIDTVLINLKKYFNMYLLSGDNDSESVFLTKYFDADKLFFNQQPHDKKEFVQQLRQNGHNVLMTGDGLNDAGAFMQCDVAISVADDIYHFSPAGDAIIEASKLGCLNNYIGFCHKSLSVVKISFVISFLYNAIGLYFALTGTLSPVVAAILMPISSVSVVAFAIFTTRWMARNLDS